MGHHGNYFLSFPAAIGEVGGWVELARTTLGSAGDTITVSDLADKRYYMVLAHKLGTGNYSLDWRLGNSSVDTATNYSTRRSRDGGSDSTSTTYGRIYGDYGGGSGNNPSLTVGYFANLSGNEKLYLGHAINQSTVGAGTAPIRIESVGKWANTSNPLDIIQGFQTESGDFSSGAEVVVLGWDPDDTHTGNFWEELADVDLSTGEADTIDTGTITAKKYLWIQAYFTASGGTVEPDLRFNGDTAANYSDRYSINGGSDATGTSVTRIRGSGVPVSGFFNTFVINNSADEKLAIMHAIYISASGAGNAPNRRETVGKWTNTTDQITSIEWPNLGAGTFGKDSFLKVWGSN